MSRRPVVEDEEDEEERGETESSTDPPDSAGLSSGEDDDEGASSTEESSELSSDLTDEEEVEEEDNDDDALFDEHEGSAEPEEATPTPAQTSAPVPPPSKSGKPSLQGSTATSTIKTAPSKPATTTTARVSLVGSQGTSASGSQTPKTPRIRRIRIVGLDTVLPKTAAAAKGGRAASASAPASGSVTPVTTKLKLSVPLKSKKRVIEDDDLPSPADDDEDQALVDDDELDDDVDMDDELGDELASGSLSPLEEELPEYSDDEDFSTSNELPDPTKLTARQRAARLGHEQDPAGAGLNDSHKEIYMTKSEKRFANMTSEEAALKRNESTRRRKNLADQKLEEEKVETIKKLLSKTVSKSKANGLDDEEGGSGAIKGGGGKKRFLRHDGEDGRPGIKFKWIDDKEKTRLCVPERALELMQSICRSRAYYPTKPTCNASGCEREMIYRTKTGSVACSMAHLQSLQSS